MNTWRWRGVLGAVTVSASVLGAGPAGAGEGSTRFADVDPEQYYATPVEWAHDAGIVEGYSSACFLPDEAATRAEVGVMLHRLVDPADDAAPGTHPFSDVTAAWQADAVAWLFRTGLTTGTGPTTFEPDRPATRAEVVTLLWRIAGEPVAATQTTFPDVTKSWQRGAVAWSEENGIALGRSPSTFDPDAAVTRGELVTFIWRSQNRPSGPNDLVAVAPRNCLVEIGRCSEMFPADLILGLASAHPGTRFTASVHDHRTGCHYELNPGLILTTASVIKAQVLAGVLLRAQDEHRALSPTESSQVELMMHFSHNRPPTSELYASIGGPAGLEAIDARFAIPGTNHTAQYGATLSTAADRTILAEQLLIGGGPLDDDHVAQAWTSMTGTSVAQTWGITAALPAGHEAALKNGFFPLSGRGWRLGSTGVVADPDGGKYAVTVMTDGNPTETAGIALVEAITTHINSALTIGDPAPRAVDAVTCIEASSAQSWTTVASLLEVSDVALVQMINGGEPAPLSGQRVCRP